jgi:hypothetical protein
MATAEAIAIRQAIAAEKQAESWASIDARLKRIEASFGIHEPAGADGATAPEAPADPPKPADPPPVPGTPPPAPGVPLKPATLAPPVLNPAK